jgi:hypothetical protein
VKSESKTVWIDHQGAIVPLKIDRDTRFEGAAVKDAKDLKEGQEIRASFMVKDRTDNVARTIALASTSGLGGSGFDKSGSSLDKSPSGSSIDSNKELTPGSTTPVPDKDKTRTTGPKTPGEKTY